MESISYDVIGRIRKHIIRIKDESLLLDKLEIWLRLTVGLDVLEDSSSAVDYYCNSDYPSSTGGKYLFTYGLMQAIFLQQDAINAINRSILQEPIDWKNDHPSAFTVRETRNDVVGHPTTTNGNQFIYLVQHSLVKGSFEYYRETPPNEGSDPVADKVQVDVLAAIDDTTKAINDILAKILAKLNDAYTQYLNAHKERKMKEIFMELGYAKAKTLYDINLESGGYYATKDMVEKCKEELIKRFGSTKKPDSYKYLLDDIHAIYSTIDNDLQRIPGDLYQAYKHYLYELLFFKLEELESRCEQTDIDFETSGME